MPKELSSSPFIGLFSSRDLSFPSFLLPLLPFVLFSLFTIPLPLPWFGCSAVRSFILNAALFRPPRCNPAAAWAAITTAFSFNLLSKVSSLPLNSPPPPLMLSKRGSPRARISSASSAHSIAFMYPSSRRKSGNPVLGFETSTWSSIMVVVGTILFPYRSTCVVLYSGLCFLLQQQGLRACVRASFTLPLLSVFSPFFISIPCLSHFTSLPFHQATGTNVSMQCILTG
mmetsp:Transcript_9490/g.17760  ORF Transcript_9490/g.17760 Transcript_9490/m.17760 type:complete len:228 (-) Transcript_9490:637-1320(-)